MKVILAILLALPLLALAGLAEAAGNNSISLTTYYPAPLGAYDHLRLVPRATAPTPPGTPCENGTMYSQTPDGNLQYCLDGVWSTFPGPWVKVIDGGRDFNNNPVDNYYLNGSYTATHKAFVGIGTNDPQNVLHLALSDPGTPEMLLIENYAVRSGPYNETSPGPGANISFRGADSTGERDVEYVAFRAVFEDQVNPRSHLRIYLRDGTGIPMNQSEKLRLTGDGYLGLRDTNPTAVLTIAGNQVSQGGNNTDDLLKIGRGPAGLDGDVLIVNRLGRVGINQLNPTEILHVDGNIKATMLILTSDATLKKNIKPLNNSLDKIARLKGVSFAWKDEEATTDHRKHMGVLAQDVEQVFPEAVYGKDGAKAVDYPSLIAPLIEAVKQLKTDNDELKQKLEARSKILKEQAREIHELTQDLGSKIYKNNKE